MNSVQYKGANIKNYYKPFYTRSGLTINDGITYKLLEIKDKITAESTEVDDGWDAFKLTFRYFETLSETNMSNRRKFDLFIEKLSEYSGLELENEFTSADIADLDSRYGTE